MLSTAELEEDIAVAAIEVPEPASFALLCLGLAGIAATRGRRA